jgi:hypothetical protein
VQGGDKGLLTPRRVRIAAVHLVGKEGNRTEGVVTGEVTDPDEVLIDYADDEWEAVVLPALRRVTVIEISRQVGMDRAGLSDYLRVRSPTRPPASTANRLKEAAAAFLADGLVRPCAVAGCGAWSRPSPSSTCSERYRRALARTSAAQPTR